MVRGTEYGVWGTGYRLRDTWYGVQGKGIRGTGYRVRVRVRGTWVPTGKTKSACEQLLTYIRRWSYETVELFLRLTKQGDNYILFRMECIYSPY